MTTKHTPGPWRWTDNSLAPVDPRPDDHSVAVILEDGDCYGFVAAETVDVLAEQDANRRLIAAAPDLLEALIAEQEWRDREAAGALDPEWDYEILVGAKRRAAIAAAIWEPKP